MRKKLECKSFYQSIQQKQQIVNNESKMLNITKNKILMEERRRIVFAFNSYKTNIYTIGF